MLAHLAGLLGFLLAPGVGNVIGPLVVWLLKRDAGEFVDDQGREALNFQLTMLLYGLISSLLCLIGIPFVLVVYVCGLVFSIIGAVKSSEGMRYRYPSLLNWNLIR